jgi:hypothetical protein
MCQQGLPFYGLSDLTMKSYKFSARCLFQTLCQHQSITLADLQHFTFPHGRNVIERTLHVPITAGADWRSLPPSLQTPGQAHPWGAAARHNFRTGILSIV